jgi:hypothetical protein
MDVGHELASVSRTGNSVVARTCDALSRTSAFLAAVLSFIARRSERMATRFDRSARWLHAKATGIPLGVDVAGDEWEEPVLLPLAPEPPPIPPAAFFTVKPPEQDEEWAAALAAAKQNTPEPEVKQKAPEPQAKQKAPEPRAKQKALEPQAKQKGPEPQAEPEPSEADWEAALLAAKKEHEAPAPKPAPKAAETKVGELRVGPKVAAARAVRPHITLKPTVVPRETTPKPIVPANPQTAATRKAVAAALRS